MVVGKLSLWSYEAVEFNSRLTAVEIAGIVQQMAFHIDLVVLTHCGTDAHVGDSTIAFAIVQINTRCVNAVLRHQNALREIHIDGWRSHLCTKMIAGVYGIGKRVRVAKKTVGPLNIAACYKLPYICGANYNTVN